jgi:UDP-N-acetylenolpyruvoylglucosamine reductase
MATVTFDTLQFVKKLQTKGFKVEQAEGISEALQEAMTVADVATRSDLRELRGSVRDDIRESEIKIIKWVVALALGQAALIVGL